MPTEVTLKNNIPILNEDLLAAFGEGLEKFGGVAQAKMTGKIDTWIPPPLAESTIKAKGSSQPLVDTGQLYIQISHEVRDSGKSVVVGVMGPRAQIAAIHEFGTEDIPERSFIRSVMNDTADRKEMNEQVIVTLRQAIKGATIT